MSFNLYGLIIKVANELNVNLTLENIGRINNDINNLISRGTSMDFIKDNLEILL